MSEMISGKGNKNNNNPLQELSALLLDIETNVPELYRFLDETPSCISNSDANVDNKVLREYLESLQRLKSHYDEEHQHLQQRKP